ncbi:hypothetical protein IBTHAUMO2_720025 [Nitrosopumilaceae archaeon]|nr:hypothetical protein IBTHAUMO2_720025 [Nitrosopumilaceae archaeon]
MVGDSRGRGVGGGRGVDPAKAALISGFALVAALSILVLILR